MSQLFERERFDLQYSKIWIMVDIQFYGWSFKFWTS